MTEQQQESMDFNEGAFMMALGFNPAIVTPGSVNNTSRDGVPRIEFNVGIPASPIALANAFASAAAPSPAAPVPEQQAPASVEPPTPFGDPGPQPTGPTVVPDPEPAGPRRASTRARKAPVKKAAARKAPARKAAAAPKKAAE